MLTPELERTLLEAVRALDALEIAYAVVGGLAVSAWASPRATRDVDLYARLPMGRYDLVEASLRLRGFDVPAMARDLAEFGVFRSLSRSDGVFLDIFDSVGPLGEAILDRRQALSIDGHCLWLVSPEDLAILKAFSERERDYEDLCELVRLRSDTLDLDYVRGWARRLDESLESDEVTRRLSDAVKGAARPVRQD